VTIVKVVQKKDQCPQCHGDKVFKVDVHAEGYSAGTEIDHSWLCPARRCRHGKVNSGDYTLQEECAACEAESDPNLEEEWS
jgi:hypothetical protein